MGVNSLIGSLVLGDKNEYSQYSYKIIYEYCWVFFKNGKFYNTFIENRNKEFLDKIW
jgi:hypothetical protein